VWEASRPLCNPFEPGERKDVLVLGRQGAGKGGMSHDDVPLLLIARRQLNVTRLSLVDGALVIPEVKLVLDREEVVGHSFESDSPTKPDSPPPKNMPSPQKLAPRSLGVPRPLSPDKPGDG
jgi:hypothetical protein